MDYHHTQVGTLMIIGLLTPMLAILLVPFLIGIFPPVLFVVFLLVVVSLALFSSLTVQITEGMLTCSFGIGIVRKQIPLRDIIEARAVKNPWYVGWGIRWMPGQYWVWNVSGLRAVELVLRNGSRFRIGTDEPEVLANAIALHLTTIG